MSHDTDDTRFMAEAIQLARQGLFTTSPNPRVGCVLVKDGRIVGRGFHQRAGGPHAEVEAIHAATEETAGTTAYVTLEPCNHYGRTPPCVNALIAARVARVVLASADPNTRVAGGGSEQLRAAGIEVCSGVLEREARELNPGYFKRIRDGLPWLRCKLAASLDGRTALASGDSQWITGPAARQDVQRLRARSCAVISGVGTVLRDDPRLDVRTRDLGVDIGRQPLRVIVDSQLRTPATARLFGAKGEVIVVMARRDPEREGALSAVGAKLLHMPGADGRVDLRALLQYLAKAQCNEILVEAGATLAGAMVSAGLVDELIVYIAPMLMGNLARPLLELPIGTMDRRIALTISDITAVGTDWRITARPVY